MSTLAMGTRTVRVGSRRSALALAQARQVIAWLTEAGVATELVPVVTEGDRSAAVVTSMAGTGVFVSALREQLTRGEVDLAVHSLKDLPTGPAPGIALAAVPVREDPRDALVSRDGRTLAELPAGAVVGTGAPRRMAQLRHAFPALSVRPLRGNVDTRLGKVAGGELDAVVVAYAGLIRLGRGPEATQVIDPALVTPAPGQGALAVECRADDEALGALLAALDHAPTRTAVTAERALLAGLAAGCSAPLGALGVVDPAGGILRLAGVAAAEDGHRLLRRSVEGPADRGEEIANQLVGDLLAAGAADVMRETQ